MTPGPQRDPGARAPDDAAADGPALTVAGVARRLGVAPATLRTWDRRYGLGPSEHSAGSHRRYSADDVARLLVMRGLTLDGSAPADAARIARETDVHADAARLAPAVARHLVALPGAAVVRADAGPAATPPGAAGRIDGAAGTSGAAGAAAAARPAGPGTPVAVVDAALAGDEPRVRSLLALPGDGGVDAWWTTLVEPVLTAVAARTVLARPGEEPGDVVAAAALAVLRAHARAHPPDRTHPSQRRVVLLMATPGEPRPLVLHALAGALVESGVDARVVAGPVGQHRLLEIVTMTAPSAVVTVTTRSAPDLATVEALAHERGDVPQFVLVPGPADAAVPFERSVHRVRSFTGLLHEVLAVAR
ncbi:MerR family transcriptional regulator [Cellulomonas hominis]